MRNKSICPYRPPDCGGILTPEVAFLELEKLKFKVLSSAEAARFKSKRIDS
jgi:hypothetical protein